ncbi:MAG: sigma 54-interacting transcriptional regulator [Acidobacteriota bacterium]
MSENSAARFCLRGEISGLEQLFMLKPGINRLGALESNEVALPLAGVSRIHAELRLDGEAGLSVRDLGSKNGTFIDGRRVDQARADLGSELRFGPVSLRFEDFHRDDAKLAISFSQPPSDATGVFPIQEPPHKTGTQISSLSRQWLILAEAFQERLLRSVEGDFTDALVMLLEEMHLESACVLELPSQGESAILSSAGRFDEEAARELRTLLRPFAERAPSREVYFDTVSHNGSTLTVGGVKSGAADPIVLALWGRFPGRLDSELFLRLLVRSLEAKRPAPRERTEQDTGEYPGLIVPPDYVYGRSDVMRNLYDLMQTLAQGDLPVLVIGETGVGKEYLAQILHGSSPRRRGPFIAINCAAIPSELLEAELFGIGDGVATGVTARKGRFRLADGGTLFLDEIGDMSADLQAKLLRALQEKEVHPVGRDPLKVDVRVLAATNQELLDRIGDGSFRADLYYRLAGYVLEIPPLRDRSEDIPPLVEHFLRQCAGELNRNIRGLTVHALRMLTNYPWPGNVRELANEVRRAVYLCPEGRTIESSLLSKTIRQHYENQPDGFETEEQPAATDAGADADGPSSSSRPFSLGLDSLNLEELEHKAIAEALRRCDDNQVHAAKLLGISRQKLRRRMERMGLLRSPGKS